MNTQNLKQLPQELLNYFRGLNLRARIAIVAALALCAAGLLYLGLSTGHVEYAPLYFNLSPEDASAVLDKLREAHVPYQIEKGGETIEIPKAQVAETRLTLASAGLPRGSGMGYDLFDKQGLGVSDFTQKINNHRALQGELERSILTLGAVQRARVHLAVPEKSLFSTVEEKPSASVVLQLRPGQTLQPPQVQGIVHLIAASVQGLQPERVTVVDQRGEILSQKSGTDAARSTTLSYQREIEGTARQRAQELLEKTVGRGHVAVQVNAQIDPAQVERTHEEFDPEQQVVRSEQEMEDTAGPSAESTGGVAGARGNLPGGPPPQTTSSEGTRRRSVTRNYEIGKVVRKVSEPFGKLERLTIAVVVDGVYAPDPKNPKQKKFMPRSKEDMEAYAAIVKEAVGFDGKRGDQLEVRCVPFAAGDGESQEMSEIKETVPPWAYASVVAALLFAGACAVQLLRRRDRVTLVPGGLHFPASLRNLEEHLSPTPLAVLPERGEEEATRLRQMQQTRQQAVALIGSHPDRALQVLRAWLQEPEGGAEGTPAAGPETTQGGAE